MIKADKIEAMEVLANGGFWALSFIGNAKSGKHHRFNAQFNLRNADGSRYMSSKGLPLTCGKTLQKKLGGAVVLAKEINSFLSSK